MGRVHHFDRRVCFHWWMAERVRVRRLNDDEGRQLQRIVRRGGGSEKSIVKWRRAMVVLASAGGNDVAAIARLVQTPESVTRADHYCVSTPTVSNAWERTPPPVVPTLHRLLHARPGDYRRRPDVVERSTSSHPRVPHASLRVRRSLLTCVSAAAIYDAATPIARADRTRLPVVASSRNGR